ncbi:MAG: carbohydrate transporter substrate-binding protein [Clostridia bacterium]|jgi:raffinose/stachyose/melibiose transport system substrate-binding protein|nr:carbohydrate transporter substrate-binding protein [Clostridia bacterium]
MKLNKLLASVLVIILAAGGAVGCSSKSDAADPSAETSSAAEAAPAASNEEAADKKTEPKETTLSLLIDGDVSRAGFDAVAALAKEKLGITVEVEIRPGGADGDNVVKTRLASGDMADLCAYNSGSLLAALNPSEYFIDISKEDWASRLDDTFVSAVAINGATYGIPMASAQAGAILYSKSMYKELGLTVPKTWDEFIANCDAIKAAGKTAILGTFADSWTAQVLYLGDHYNVAAKDPNFAKDFEAGKTKYASSEAGLNSWKRLAATSAYYNKDSLATTYDDGCDIMANGEAGHWAMLTQSLSNIYELYGDKVNDIGVFGIPGDDPNNQGLTVWMPTAIYGNKNSDKTEDILRFMEFYISDEALNAYAGAVLPDGPYCVKGYELPDTAYDAVKNDMQAYFDAGKTVTALEFQTPVKGPNCPAISQECAAGLTSAEEAAAAYDADCLKQAVQLGLDWK